MAYSCAFSLVEAGADCLALLIMTPAIAIAVCSCCMYRPSPPNPNPPNHLALYNSIPLSCVCHSHFLPKKVALCSWWSSKIFQGKKQTEISEITYIKGWQGVSLIIEYSI